MAMQTRSLQLAALFTASLSLVPSGLLADADEGASRERWIGYIDMGGRRVPLTLAFENGMNDSILGDVELGDTERDASAKQAGGRDKNEPEQAGLRADLENVAIVGSKMFFNVKGLQGNPTFRGEIAPDGLGVAGTYSVHGKEHPFLVRYEEPNASVSFAGAKSEEGAPSHGTLERWNGGITTPGGAVGLSLSFANNADGTVMGELSIPSSQVSRVRVTDFAISGSTLHFSVPNVPGNPAFSGVIAEDGQTVAGTFTQLGNSYPFTLTYEENAKEIAASAKGGEVEGTVTIKGPERWEGFVELPTGRMKMLCDFAAMGDETIVGRMAIPHQGAAVLEMRDVSIRANDLSFKVADMDGESSFRGVIGADAETVRGTYILGGREFACELKYVESPVALEAAAAADFNALVAAPKVELAMNDAASQPSSRGSEVDQVGTVWALPPGVNAAAKVASGGASAGQAAPPDRWDGVIELPGQKLSFNLDFVGNADGTITGDITIPVQGARDLPLTNISIVNDAVKATIKGIPGDPTFSGKINAGGERVEGTFTQGGGSFPFYWTFAGSGSSKVEDGLLSGYKEWLDQARKQWRAPGVAVAIIKDGRVIFMEGLGTKDTEEGGAVTADTVFAIGSCTKAFTTFVMGTMVDEGKLDWDKPVRSYLPSFKLQDPFAAERLSPRDLVTHRSGLPRHDLLWYNNSGISREEIVGRLAYLEPSKDFRQTVQYNNLMFVAAGYLTERVMGKTWETCVSERILTPLGMGSTNFGVVEMQKMPDFAAPHEFRDEAMRKMPFRDLSVVAPAGAINSSVSDMSRWIALHLGNGTHEGKTIISKSTLAELHRPQMVMPSDSVEPAIINIGCAMGWFVAAYRGHLMVEHGGNIDGFSALVTMLPKDGIGVVALTNMNSSPLPRMATYHALDRLLGAEVKDWSSIALGQRSMGEAMQKDGKAKKLAARKEGTTASRPIAEYAGEYSHPGYGVTSVAESAGQLSFAFNGITVPLNHWHYDVFAGGKNPIDPTFEDLQINFRGNLSGDIDALEVVFEPTVKPVVFERKASAKMVDAGYIERFVGQYELGPRTFVCSLRGETLMMMVEGQPAYELVATKEDTFALKGVNGYSVRFLSEGGKIVSAEFIQPDGVYTAKRR